MGPFATAVLSACLQALRYLLWITAGLLVALAAVQALRGDPSFKPLTLVFLALLFAIGGFVSGRAASALLARGPRL
jgi:hypothetical protein